MDAQKFKRALKNINTPRKVMHAGSLHYLDPIREKYVPATPEEEVRQKILQYLMKVLRVPKQAISVEYLLSKAGIDSKNRADIVVWYYEPNDGYWYALGVIECKAPDVDIMTEDVKEQVFGYADDLLVDYVVVVNGVYSCCWLYDNKDGYKNLLKKLPEYQKMIDKDVEFDDYYKTPERFKFEELEANKYNLINERSILGEKTNPDHLTFLTNLYDCLILDKNEMPKGKYRYFELVEDYGVRYLKVGNSSGGKYVGYYRSFKVRKNGQDFFMNISIFDYGSESKDHNILTVSSDSKGKNHNSLQYSLKKVGKIGNAFHFIHKGNLTCGKWGACKISEFKEFLTKKAPFLLKNGKIDLGTINNNRLLCMNDAEIVKFIENILSYALIRDEYRDLVDAKKRKEKSYLLKFPTSEISLIP